MKSRLFITALGLLLLIGSGGLAITLVRLGGFQLALRPVAAQTQPVQLALAQTAPHQNNAPQVAGNYSGYVELEVTVAGLFSQTLNTQAITDTPDLGVIDLALAISHTGSVLTGYVDLDKTLVFSAEHTLQRNGAALKIGPTVNGTFDGANLILLSERVTANLNGQSIQRQFRLTGAVSKSDGSQINGEYRETLWGAAHLPVTVIGKFSLQRPVFDNSQAGPGTDNQAPETVLDSATTARGTAVIINVLANDRDPNGDALTITAVGQPQFGTATTDGQRITYTPNASFVGTETVSYVVSDGKGGTATGSVTITVIDSATLTKQLYLPLINR